MENLLPSHYNNVFKHYKKNHFFFPIIGAVLENKQKGIVLTDNNSNPTSFFICHNFGFAQCFQISENDFFIEELNNFFDHGKLFGIFSNLPEKIRLYASPKKLTHLLKISSKKHIEKAERVQMHIRKTDMTNVDIPKNLKIEKINLSHIDKLNQAFSIDLDHRFWPSKNSYLDYGLGYVLVSKSNHELLSTCYSAAISNKLAEIDIITCQNQRSKGYARIIAEYFINECFQNSIIPNWDCYTNNIPSHSLAKKLNFKESFIYDFYIIKLVN